MVTSHQHSSQKAANMTPFIARFANKLSRVQPPPIRYDMIRQMTQVLQDGQWVDSSAAKRGDGPSRVTLVQAETTDDA